MKRIILPVILSIIVFGCARDMKQTSKPVVSISILPLQYFVLEIAGDIADINLLVPPGYGPENYEPGYKEILKLSDSKLLIYINLFDVEKQLTEKLRQTNSKLKLLDVSKDIDLIKEGHNEHKSGGHAGGIDPHIWTSVKNARIIASNVEEGLSQCFPEHKNKFKENLNTLLKKLDNLDIDLQTKFATAQRKSFIVYHPALTYLSRDYNLDQRSLEEEGKNPSARHMKELIDYAKATHIKTVFLQSQFDKNNIEAFADEINAKVIRIDPLSGDWLNNMKLMTDNILKSLNE